MGNNGSIIRRMLSRSTFKCIFDIYYYPFDEQLCHVIFTLKTSQDDALINPRNVIISFYGKQVTPEFYIYVQDEFQQYYNDQTNEIENRVN